MDLNLTEGKKFLPKRDSSTKEFLPTPGDLEFLLELRAAGDRSLRPKGWGDLFDAVECLDY